MQFGTRLATVVRVAVLITARGGGGGGFDGVIPAAASTGPHTLDNGCVIIATDSVSRYPEYPHYNGAGDPNAAGKFTCVAP